MRIFGLALTALIMVGTSSGSAHASDEIGLSTDGSTWASILPEPLFASAIRWVPGDSRTESFFVRNQASDDGDLSVRVLASAQDDLMETGDLRISARSGEGPWSRVDEPGTHVLVERVLAPGERERVDVRVDFDPASTNVSRLRSLDLQLDARLTRSVPDPAGERDEKALVGDEEIVSDAGERFGVGGLLPGTGGAAFWLLLLAGAAAVAGAATLTHRGRI